MSFSRSFLSLKKYSQELIYLTNFAEITEEVLTKSIYATHIVEVTEEVLTKKYLRSSCHRSLERSFVLIFVFVLFLFFQIWSHKMCVNTLNTFAQYLGAARAGHDEPSARSPSFAHLEIAGLESLLSVREENSEMG